MTQKLTRLQAAEQAAEIAETKAKAAREKLQALRKEQDRKAQSEARKIRNKALFQVGGLVEIAGLLDADKGALLGGLIAVAKTLKQGPGSTGFQEWKSAGDALLAERKAAQTTPVKTPVKPSAETEPDPESDPTD